MIRTVGHGRRMARDPSGSLGRRPAVRAVRLAEAEEWMMTPDCSRHADALNCIKKLLATERAVPDLRLYITTYPGRRFDREIDHQVADDFTLQDLRAVRHLGVSVSFTTQEWLVGEGREEVRLLLQSIPSNLDIWEVPREDINAMLGPGSPAWRLWKILSEKQQESKSAWKGGTAGKLLHGKRPRLIPIYDQSKIGRKLGVSRSGIWEAMWCALRDPEVRQSLRVIQADVDEAAHLSLLRVLNIVVWMSALPEASNTPASSARPTRRRT